MNICKPCKILNNKDCGLNTKPSYKENLAHAWRIWDTYQRPCSNLDVFFWHTKEYKVSKPTISFHTKLWYYMFFNHIYKFCRGYEMCCKKLKKHSSLFWMLNQKRNAWTSSYWHMESSNFGKVSSLNGRGGTSLMDLEMC